MGDEDECEAPLFLDLLKQVEDLGLDRDVQCAGGFVQKDELWIK